VYEPIFQALNAAGVRYVVIGGLATVLHGYARLTADVDLAVDLASEEATKVIQTLTAAGFRPQVPVDPKTFADRTTREQWMREKHRRAFSLIDPANPMRVVDLLLEYPVPFEELWAHSREVSIQATRIRIASVDHLIALKRQAGRPQTLQISNNWKSFVSGTKLISMSSETIDPPGQPSEADWDAAQQDLLAATLAATPAQRLAWLEEALRLAYASGALKPRQFIQDRDAE
jgi:predicted nucleotidyltransferase